MKGFGESALRSFSMDGPTSIYDFEGENYKDKEKVCLAVWKFTGQFGNQYLFKL